MRRRRFLASLAALAAGGAGAGVLPACRQEGLPTAAPQPQAAGTAQPPPASQTSPSLGAAEGGQRPPPPAPAPLVVPLLCRDAWGAQPARGQFEPNRVQRLTVHHSAVRLDDNREAPAHLRSHQQFHQQDRGWPDIAYHVAVDRNGHAYALRSADAVGSASNYDPRSHFLVLAEGSFEQQAPSPDQLEGLARVLAWAVRAFGVPSSAIAGHRDYAPTTCPGDALYAALQSGTLRARVDQLLAAGGVDLGPMCGAEASARVAAIEAGRI